jgi:hypothetical protein
MILLCAGQKLDLLPERALFWQDAKSLVLSDVHLGKAESWRAQGLAIPAESGASDLARLRALIAERKPRSVYILGDFIHERRSWSLDLIDELSDFFAQHSQIDWTLILGNHERGSHTHLERLPMALIDEALERPPFLFQHGHRQRDGATGYRLCGHLHPQVSLHQGPRRLRCPCFVVGPHELWLPAFGTWTGGMTVKAKKDERIFAVAGREVFEVHGH